MVFLFQVNFQLKPKVCEVEGRMRLPKQHRMPATLVEQPEWSSEDEEDDSDECEIELSTSEEED